MPFVVVAVATDEEVCCPKCSNRLPVGLNAFCDRCGYPLFREVKIGEIPGEDVLHAGSAFLEQLGPSSGP